MSKTIRTFLLITGLFLLIPALLYSYFFLGLTLSKFHVFLIIAIASFLIGPHIIWPEEEHKLKGLPPPTYIPPYFMTVAQALMIVIFGAGYFFLQSNLEVYGRDILLAAYVIPVLFLLVVMYIRRRDVNSFFYIFTHYPKEALILFVSLGLTLLGVWILFTYTECTLRGEQNGLSCVLQTLNTRI